MPLGVPFGSIPETDSKISGMIAAENFLENCKSCLNVTVRGGEPLKCPCSFLSLRHLNKHETFIIWSEHPLSRIQRFPPSRLSLDSVSVLTQCYQKERSMSTRHKPHRGDSIWNNPSALLLLRDDGDPSIRWGDMGFLGFFFPISGRAYKGTLHFANRLVFPYH